MDVHQIKISQSDIDSVLAETTPTAPAGSISGGDACAMYAAARPVLLIASTILQVFYPPAGPAIATVVAILDRACKP